MKIAHLSDLHLNSFFSNSNLDKIRQALVYAIQNGVDHIAITGDLTDNADEKDFEILRNLFIELDILNSNRLSLIVGNHDIFGGIQTAEDIFSFPERCKLLDYNKKLEEFISYFRELFIDSEYLSPNGYFPFAKIIKNVLITGVNSIPQYSKLKNPFGSNGEISILQLEELIKIFDTYRNRVKSTLLLVHHHFNKMKISKGNASASIWQNIEKQTMKLRKKKRLYELFKKYEVDLILHGHYHESHEYIRKNLRFFNAGASIKGRKDSELNINFVTIKSGHIKTETHKIVFDKLLGTMLKREPRLIEENKLSILNQEALSVNA